MISLLVFMEHVQFGVINGGGEPKIGINEEELLSMEAGEMEPDIG